MCELTADRITTLPADVIHRILVFLPIKDAAKTSILSTKWRHHWRCTPQLVFDLWFANEHGGWESNEMMNKLMSIIHKILLVRDGPIRRLELSVPGSKPHEMDQILIHLSNTGLQELCLDYYNRSRIYKVHSTLFACVHLNYMRLWFCEFIRHPPWFLGFNKLRVLELGHVILPADFFGNFLSKYCPMLKKLSAIYCEGVGNLEIVAPCLEEFDFLCYKLQKICFKCTPRLSTARLRWYGKLSEVVDTVDFSASLPALERLYVGFQFLQYVVAGDNNAPIRLPNPLERLKFLTIDHLDMGCLKKARPVARLIMSSPNLHALTIKLDTKQLDQPTNSNAAVPNIGTLLEAEDRNDTGCCLQHLKVLRLEKMHGIQAELNLVRFILATAPLLEKVHIATNDKLEDRNAAECMEEVMQYKRVSQVAEFCPVGGQGLKGSDESFPSTM
ncbi:unnamed protein product [Linum trigynum]|uniref:F-box domain-containing protein n=1 Tax=Linum trigynum TaxID=586398 RepID=A0AAV2F345_9ROSI